MSEKITEQTPTLPTKNEREWTIMLYLSGDNNLSQDMVTGLIGIKECIGRISKKVALLAYFDSGNFDIPSVYMDFTDSLLIRLSNPDAKRGDRAEGETSPESLKRFVKWCVSERGHTADNYALILSGHGDGFQRDNFLRDESSATYISMRKLGDTLSELHTGRGYNPRQDDTLLPPEPSAVLGKKISILGFDSCVMGSLEVAAQLDHAVDTIVGSQGFVPNAGWNYGKIVKAIEKRIKDKRSLDRLAVADIFARSVVDHYRDYALFGEVSLDIAVCDLLSASSVDPAKTAFKVLRESVEALAEKLTRALESEATNTEITRAILIAHWRCQTYLWDQSIDIRDFCELLRVECRPEATDDRSRLLTILDSAATKDASIAPLQELHARLKAEDKTVNDIITDCGLVIDACIECAKSYSVGPELQYSTGFSLYFPWSLISFEATKHLYTKLEFSDPTSIWVKFISTFLERTFRLPKMVSDKPRYLFDADGAAFAEAERADFILNRVGNSALPFEVQGSEPMGGVKVGQPQVKVGQPQIKVGQPQVKVGQPQVKVGQPQVKVGQPQVKVGQPQIKLSQGFFVSNNFNFCRTKNFPWSPRTWDMQDALDRPSDD